jgi:epoxyqueuosine reductase
LLNPRDKIALCVAQEGLEFLGIAPATTEEKTVRAFQEWLLQKKHADMFYLEKYLEVRQDPTLLLPGAKSIVVFAWNYYQGDRWSDLKSSGVPAVAQYARLADYHKVMAQKAEAIAEKIRVELGCDDSVRFRSAIDTLPLFERDVAARTAEGFIGKNSMFIHPTKGSFLLLGSLLTTLDLTVDVPSGVDPEVRSPRGGCGTCQRCQVYCPTGALAEDYKVDASKCLSYWTIENRGTIPEVYWPWLRYYYFGCDICQLVCPYNKHIETSRTKPNELPSLYDVATMDQRNYEKFFGGTSMTRAKRSGLRRNALIAMTVLRDPRLDEAIRGVDVDSHPVLEETVTQIRKWTAPPS